MSTDDDDKLQEDLKKAQQAKGAAEAGKSDKVKDALQEKKKEKPGA